MKTLYLVLLIVPLLLILPENVNSQQSTSTVIPPVLEEGSRANEVLKEQVATTAQQTSLPIDTVTIGGIVAATGGLLFKDRKDKKDLETKLTVQEIELKRKEDELRLKNQEITEIIMTLEVVNYKIFNSAYIYDTKTFRQILDLKSTNNPLEKNTLGEEYALQINKLAKFTSVNYNVPMPNMSIPSSQVINASSVSEQIQHMVVKTPPPTHIVNPSASTDQKPKAVAQAPANQTANESSVVAETDPSTATG
jgi:gas vesicle protein